MRTRYIAWILIGCSAFGSRIAAALEADAQWCALSTADEQAAQPIVCTDVDAGALRFLNDVVARQGGALEQRLSLADAWARKYRVLRQHLDAQSARSARTETLQRMLAQGRIREAAAQLDAAPLPQAAYHSERGLLYALELNRPQALSHLRKARELDPDRFDPRFEYARALHEDGRWHEATAEYEGALAIARKGALTQPPVFSPLVAQTLQQLGAVYRAIAQLHSAERAYREALDFYRGSSGCSPPAAAISNSLGVMYHTNGRTGAAETAYGEAVQCYRELAAATPHAYAPDLAGALGNLAVMYRDGARLDQADHAYRAAAAQYRKLIRLGAAAYRAQLADTLNKLGMVAYSERRFDAAEDAYRESLASYRELAREQPAAYLADVAGILNNLGVLLRDDGRSMQARAALHEAAKIRSQLAARAPADHLAGLVQTLLNLRTVYDRTGWTFEASGISDRLQKLGVAP